MTETLKYYNDNADTFVEGTIHADMHDALDRFLEHIPSGGRVLDFGCGSGRDTKYMLEHGYDTEAIDGSEELCKKASELVGKTVQCMQFQDFKADAEYDGIWCCASLLHLQRGELLPVITALAEALKAGGSAYLSFKYGEFEGVRNGRYFTDMTEDLLAQIIDQIDGMKIVDQWITSDVRPGRDEEKWVNVIVEKTV